MENGRPPVSQRGFTLIELSIVLVIIGLVVGGVLVGRDLIHAAEIRRVVKEYSNLETAYNTFKVKYNCLPGDCLNATDFWGTSSTCGVAGPSSGSTCNGNGDGLIAPYDTRWVCQHLTLAGFIPGSCIGGWNGSGVSPQGVQGGVNAIRSNYGPTALYEIQFIRGGPVDFPYHVHFSTGNYISAGNDSAWGSYYPLGDTAAGMQTVDARAVDQKIDDGLPATGRFSQIDNWGGCADNINNVYLTNIVGLYCTSYYLIGN